MPYSISDRAKLIPSTTEEGSPGPLEKNIPFGLSDKTSSMEEFDGKTKTSHPCETSLFKIDLLIPKSIATIFNLCAFVDFLILSSNLVLWCYAISSPSPW